MITSITQYWRYIYMRIIRWFRPKQYRYRKPKHPRIARSVYPDQRLGFNEYWQYVHHEAQRQSGIQKSQDNSHTQAYPPKPAQNPVKRPKTT